MRPAPPRINQDHLQAAAKDLYILAATIVSISDSMSVDVAKLALAEDSPIVAEARRLVAQVEGRGLKYVIHKLLP